MATSAAREYTEREYDGYRIHPSPAGLRSDEVIDTIATVYGPDGSQIWQGECQGCEEDLFDGLLDIVEEHESEAAQESTK